MTDEQVRRTLLIEVHRCIENAADEAVAKLGLRRSRPAPAPGEIDPEALLTYPPTNALTEAEDDALRSMVPSSLESSALRQLIADGCATAFFHFFNLLDATGDPEVKPSEEVWLGAWVVAPRDDRDRDMLHDGFYETYAEYQEAGKHRGAAHDHPSSLRSSGCSPLKATTPGSTTRNVSAIEDAQDRADAPREKGE